MPTASDIPIIDKLLSVMPMYLMSIKLPIRQTGIVITVTKVARSVCMKKIISSAQSSTALKTSEVTPESDRRIKSD